MIIDMPYPRVQLAIAPAAVMWVLGAMIKYLFVWPAAIILQLVGFTVKGIAAGALSLSMWRLDTTCTRLL